MTHGLPQTPTVSYAVGSIHLQNMEKYFGFRVRVSDFLEPEDYEAIRNVSMTLQHHSS